MAQRVRFPDRIEPLVEFVEETTPERIVVAALPTAGLAGWRSTDEVKHAAEVMHL